MEPKNNSDLIKDQISHLNKFWVGMEVKIFSTSKTENLSENEKGYIKTYTVTTGYIKLKIKNIELISEEKIKFTFDKSVLFGVVRFLPEHFRGSSIIQKGGFWDNSIKEKYDQEKYNIIPNESDVWYYGSQVTTICLY